MDVLTGRPVFLGFLVVVGLCVAALVWIWTSSPYQQATRVVLTFVGLLTPLVWPGAFLVAKLRSARPSPTALDGRPAPAPPARRHR